MRLVYQASGPGVVPDVVTVIVDGHLLRENRTAFDNPTSLPDEAVRFFEALQDQLARIDVGIDIIHNTVLYQKALEFSASMTIKTMMSACLIFP